MRRALYALTALAVLVGAVLLIGAPAQAACTEYSGVTEVWCPGTQLAVTGGGDWFAAAIVVGFLTAAAFGITAGMIWAVRRLIRLSHKVRYRRGRSA